MSQGVLVMAPAYTLFWSYSCLQSYSELGAPSSRGKPTHVFSPGRQPWWCVTAGRTLAVAISGGGLHYSGVGDMVGLEHFLSIRETWVGQP